MYCVKNDILVINMNQVKQPVVTPVDVCALSSVVMAAVMLKFMQKAHMLDSAWNMANVCISFMGISVLASSKKNEFHNKVHIYFSEDEKRGVITMYDAPIHSLKICENGKDGNKAPYEMTAVLNKMIVGQGKNYKAVRKIGVENFKYSRDGGQKNIVTPHVTLQISGKSFKSELEASFSPHEKEKGISLNLKSRRYVEYASVSPNDPTALARKAMKMSIDKKSFLMVLLKKYLTTDSVEQDIKKAVYLAENFSYLIPKTALESLKKTAKNLHLLHSQHCGRGDILKNIEKFINALGEYTFPVPSMISEADSTSLKKDILELVKTRACVYENLHETLNRDSYSDAISPGVEEIIACYPTKGNQPTNAFFKKMISANKDLSSKMHVIHGFIDTCKKISNKKLHYLMLNSELLENIETDTYAYGVLSAFVEPNPQKERGGESVGAIIDEARNRVARKYSAAFREDIVGIIERVSVNVSEVSVKITKVKDIDELCPHNMEPISLEPVSGGILR